ncbi:PD-(D/E)XK nuclease family protein, partial [Patescibacteria group bacterium]|nr:PD-(D/E)XK nuclease family protein [Patescibacteria group bacterium]
KAKSLPLAFGSAIHHALENFYIYLKKYKKVQKGGKLAEYFEEGLRREVVTKTEFKDLLKKGKEVLLGYYNFYEEDFRVPLYNEYNFAKGTVLLDRRIMLTGKVDRIELIEDGDGESVTVVDYKTG